MSNTIRVAVVSGANRGLGLETSRQLATEGVTVIMAGRDPEGIEAAAASLTEQGLSVLPAVLDVTNDDQLEALRARIEADFGRLDILINNAGVITGEGFFGNSVLTVDREAIRDTLEVNLVAPITVTRALLPLLRESEAGRIVNLSSALGSLTINRDFEGDFAGAKPLAYNASKAALNMFTVGLAAELQDTAIKVNSAHPGWVKTDMGTDAAPMEVEDGARTAVALALLDDDGPTGQFMHLGEGMPW
jgi:NAD(P)-dependent dehydrogenase (short-subunit alcohol dehydrogenase family)